MKIYADCCDFFKLSHLSYALFLTLMVVAGCSSTTPITRTYVDYIPPISREGQECLSMIAEAMEVCNGQADIEQQQCQANAQADAQGAFKDAQIDFELRKGELQKQAASQPIEKYQAYSNIAISMLDAMKPQLSGFVQDGHCYSNNKCRAEYNEHYSKCGGKVLPTMRCFANCGDKE
jgi:hypothetical protein